MIFRIKVSLLDVKSKIWRRLEVDSSITLQDLHEYIQVAFEWSNAHSHQFIVDHRDLFTLGDKGGGLIIGPKGVDHFGSSSELQDEREVKLSDVLDEEQFSLTYVYDLEENWRHEVLLEKVLSEEENADYPRCLMVVKAAPEEGKRAQYEESPKHASGEMKRINERFAVLNSGSNGDDFVLSEDPWQELFELTLAYKKLKPWKWIHSSQMFIVEIPETGELAYCSVLGMSGQEFGLGVHVGNDGLAYSIMEKEGYDDIQTILEYQTSLLLSFSDRNELKAADLKLIKNQGLRLRGSKEWPLFRRLSPGYFSWQFSNEEARMFSGILKHAIHVAEKAREKQDYLLEGYDGRWRARLQESGEWVDAVMEAVVESDEEEPLRLSEIEMRRVQKYRQVKKRIELASFFEEEAIQERPGERPIFPNVVLAVEDEAAMVVYYQVFERVDYGRQLQEALFRMLSDLTYLPAEICVDSERVALKIVALTSKLGIRLSLVDRLLNVEEVRVNIGR
ncbi:MAG: plasmid pRiA4b ORF-3 family protein [Anaerobacillus sp.]